MYAVNFVVEFEDGKVTESFNLLSNISEFREVVRAGRVFAKLSKEDCKKWEFLPNEAELDNAWDVIRDYLRWNGEDCVMVKLTVETYDVIKVDAESVQTFAK